MEENNKPEKITLTQRRAASGAKKLKKSKLQNISGDDDKKGGSKLVVWLVIIVAALVATYLGLQQFVFTQEAGVGDGGGDEELAPTPTADPLANLISSTTLPDASAQNVQPESAYNSNEQSVGEESEANFTLSSLYMQRYETFLRVEFTVSSDNLDNLFPATNATYDSETKEITIGMSNIIQDQTELDYEETVPIDDSVLRFVSHDTASGNNESYRFTLADDSSYTLHTIESDLGNIVVLDIKELEIEPTEEPVDTQEPDADGDEDPVEPTVEPTQASSGDSQSISATVSGNVVSISKYQWADIGNTFTYELYINGGVPGVVGTTEDGKLTLEVSNLASDGIVGNGGSGSTDFAAAGSDDVSKVDISNSGGKSVYEFSISGDFDYTLSVEGDGAKVVLKITT